MSVLKELLKSGLDFLLVCFSANVLTGLIPAFLIAGAIAVFVSQASVIKYLGFQANKFISYGAATLSGIILMV